MRILVTGTAGFIGFHLARLLLRSGHEIAGVDGLTPYYDVTLKRRREGLLLQNAGFQAHEVMLEDTVALHAIADAFQPEAIIHLAAQAGVRYSLENPRSYVEANLVGTFNVMELARLHAVKHFMLASTSSVYGANTLMPFVEDERTDYPLTLYAATKKATEVMSHSYSHLWNIPTTAFRFFTVYGPWGRPDMALFKFTSCMLRGEPIDVYNHGEMYRDFTYVDDLVKAVALLLNVVPARATADATDDHLGTSPVAPFRVVNIGKGSPVRLLDFIEEIERCVGHRAIRNYMPMQPGDVPHTYANVDLLERLTGYRPDTEVAVGVAAFVAWYKDYYGC
ncbi:NAD-dependent epimerase/dehydratase family protein [Roseixanthobacter pseudopolyaromaticivorans]|uniref:NAD-dependent epimerase/dehydratase family protein n=1 Tax=Xanthobacteraceae TaxID=335928 RepID=UPI00372C1570